MYLNVLYGLLTLISCSVITYKYKIAYELCIKETDNNKYNLLYFILFIAAFLLLTIRRVNNNRAYAS